MPDKAGETSYSLKEITTRFKDDGTRLFITLEMHEAPPARFYVNYEGLSFLIGHLTTAAQKMPQMMEKAGTIEKYREKVQALEAPTFSCLSAALAKDDSGRQVLRVQTQEGPMFTIAFDADAWLRIAGATTVAAPGRSGPLLQ